MKKFTARQYAHALFESINDTDPKDTDKVLDNFVKVLAGNNDLRLFEEIANEFHQLELKAKGITQVELKSAHTISRENEKEILQELNKLVKGQVEIRKKIDENLIGGVVVRIEDKVIDASVKNQLGQLKESLTK